ncbi:Extracellular tyrosine-protein kinase PKDCC [Lamellibrachia satsuma]|nr:Extracellular tyrosine-protein kinase PKDCC [Lamellibrachia satsuma]
MWRRRKNRITLASFLCSSFVVLFLFANLLILHGSFRNLYDSTLTRRAFSRVISATDDTDTVQLPAYVLSPEARKRQTAETSKGGADDDFDDVIVSLTTTELRRIISQTSDCQRMQNLSSVTFIAHGWNKAVYKTTLDGSDVAVKMVDLGSELMGRCLQEQGLGHKRCYDRASMYLFKELLFLRAIRHPNIVRVLGSCVTSSAYDGRPDTLVKVATELGETIDLIRLLQMSWEDRLRVCYGLTKLIEYLARAPHGSVALNDFRKQQFVLVSGELKLTDADDIGFDEPRCKVADDCVLHFSSPNVTIRSECRRGHCAGLNEKKNTYNAARHFMQLLLPHGAPASLRPLVDILVDNFSSVTMTTQELLKSITKIVELYRSGSYVKRAPRKQISAYHEIRASDLPGQWDYHCRYTVASSGCTVSVFDRREAEDMCDAEPDCRAFVLSSERTWTGRIIAYLKNNVSTPTANAHTDLYVKPTI